MTYQQHVAKRGSVPVSQQARPDQVQNDEGGYVFAVDAWKRAERFLILGNEGGDYYVGEPELTRESAAAIEECAGKDADRLRSLIWDISARGRAYKNTPAIFALALLSGQREFRGDAVRAVCRTGAHILQYASMVESFRGWGRGLRKTIADWYDTKSLHDLAYQVAKYPQRGGWSHRDLLRLSHPGGKGHPNARVYDYICERKDTGQDNEPLLDAVDMLHAGETGGAGMTSAEWIREHRLTREMVPTELLNSPDVWDALLDAMPMTAMIRNLGKMTDVGLLMPFSEAVDKVTARLRDVERLRQARVHPVAVLLALRTYASGSGFRGNLSWSPVTQVVEALDEAFYHAFENVEPSGKNVLLALDVSASMGGNRCAGAEALTCCDGAAAMAMAVARREPNHHIFGFADEFRALPITAKHSLDGAINVCREQNFGWTDCSLPMVYARENNLDVDCFVVLTDSETGTGGHPFLELDRYRQQRGRATRLIVCGMTASQFSIADPADSGTMDVHGFDTTVPRVISEFAASMPVLPRG